MVRLLVVATIATFLLVAVPVGVYANCGALNDGFHNPISRIEYRIGPNWINPRIKSRVGDGTWLTIIEYDHKATNTYSMTAYVVGYKVVGREYRVLDENKRVVDSWAEFQYGYNKWNAIRGRITYGGAEEMSLETGATRIIRVSLQLLDEVNSLVSEMTVKHYDDLKHLAE